MFSYTAKWYNRQPNTEDPWISIGNHPIDVIYGEHQHSGHLSLIRDNKGVNVFIRNSNGIAINHGKIYRKTFQHIINV